MMENKKTVISRADILLPDFDVCDERWNSYAVIACDQFTSQPEYWEKAEEIALNQLSALSLILPEAYLNTKKEAAQKAIVAENMKSIADKLVVHKDCLIFVERTLPDGRIRRGIVGKLDLSEYDFSADSTSAVRATEETVVERIPPRVAVRREATVELPHVMVFANDTERILFEPLKNRKDQMEKLYSFDLMLGGGHIEGYKISGELLCEVETLIGDYENSATGGLVYAMGDGNHSLASAKAHYEQLRSELGDGAVGHPSAYALVEVVDIYDDAIDFEPIYRLLINCDGDSILDYIKAESVNRTCDQTVTFITKDEKRAVSIPHLHELTMGSLQILIDGYLLKNPGVECDYIHGEETLERLACKEGSVGFVCGGVEKEELFPYVAANGTLPRKTFSMGEASGKRYYIEARKIK